MSCPIFWAGQFFIWVVEDIELVVERGGNIEKIWVLIYNILSEIDGAYGIMLPGDNRDSPLIRVLREA